MQKSPWASRFCFPSCINGQLQKTFIFLPHLVLYCSSPGDSESLTPTSGHIDLTSEVWQRCCFSLSWIIGGPNLKENMRPYKETYHPNQTWPPKMYCGRLSLNMHGRVREPKGQLGPVSTQSCELSIQGCRRLAGPLHGCLTTGSKDVGFLGLFFIFA